MLSNRVAAGLFAQLSVMFGGVHGVYVVLVLAVAAAVRSVTHNMRLFVPFDDLPCTVRASCSHPRLG